MNARAIAEAISRLSVLANEAAEAGSLDFATATQYRLIATALATANWIVAAEANEVDAVEVQRAEMTSRGVRS